MTERPPMFDALCAVSARIGADIALVQAGGGNTSCKHAGVLWVKASGRWLARALAQPMFVPLDLAVLHAGIAANDDSAAQRARLPAPGTDGLRPSIETSLHALLPHPVVLHGHPVGALALLACRTPDAVFAQRLQGLRWQRLPYVRPGLPLTQAVRAALAAAPADVLLLDNHGIVVGAGTPEAAEALLVDVARRLDTDRPPADHRLAADQAVLDALAAGSAYRPAPDPLCHALALDARQRAWAAGGAPYPDHVVFLGGGLPMLHPVDRAGLAAAAAPALLVAGAGVLVHEALDDGALAMLRCLADVAARIAAQPVAEPVYLPAAEVEALQQWDAERFRRAQSG